MTGSDPSGWAASLLRAVFAGDTATAHELLDDDTVLDAPRAYPVEGRRGIAEVVHAWPRHYPYALETVDTVATHVAGSSSATELRLALADGPRKISLPVAVVSSVVGGARLVRVYHSERLLAGERRRRRPVFAVAEGQDPTPSAELHPVVARYVDAIASGDPDAVLERLADGAAIDNGVRPVDDRGELRRIYDVMCATGGVRLVRGHELDTGDAVVFEYTGLPRESTDRVPRTPPGGGVAVYRYDAASRITGVHVFDDFDPDALLASSGPDHQS